MISRGAADDGYRVDVSHSTGVAIGDHAQVVQNIAAVYQSRSGAAGVQPVPRQLPAVPPDFTGRRRELAELTALCTSDVDAPSPLVISGLGGVGKSTLAIRLAHELAPRYPDGQLYRSMRGPDGPTRPEVVLSGFLRALGTPVPDVPIEPAEQAAQFRSRLAGKRVLIVLDDVSGEQSVRPLLPGEPTCLVVVTSRNPLPALAGAAACPLAVPDAAECLELLGVIAGTERVAADRPASERLVELCGRLPLALRIVAAHLRARTDWTMQHVADLLSRERRLLAELQLGDLDVRASLELSYRDLPPGAARLFRLLAAVPGLTFAAELAAALCGHTAADTDALLDRLVLDQLIEPGGSSGRYRMHPLLWVLANELLLRIPDETSSARDATFRWYGEQLFAYVEPGGDAALTEKQGTAETAEVRTRLDAEESNVIALLEISDRSGFDWYTAHFGIGVAVFARSRALWPAWKRAIDLGLAAAIRIGDGDRQASLLLELADYQMDQESDPEAAEASLAEALRQVDGEAVPGLTARLHYRLAQLHREAGRTAEAERELAASVAAAAGVDEILAGLIANQFHAESLANWSDLSGVDDLLCPNPPTVPEVDEEALRTVVELLAPAREVWATQEKTVTEIPLRLLLASAYVGTRRYEPALIELRRGRDLCREYGEREYAPSVFLLLGKVCRELGLKRRAREAWEEGLTVVAAAGPAARSTTAARLAYELGDWHAREREHAAAVELFDYAAQAFGAADQFRNRAGALGRKAAEEREQGDVAAEPAEVGKGDGVPGKESGKGGKARPPGG
jgi:Mrp family chromosome partitioning ATPase